MYLCPRVVCSNVSCFAHLVVCRGQLVDAYSTFGTYKEDFECRILQNGSRLVLKINIKAHGSFGNVEIHIRIADCGGRIVARVSRTIVI